MRELLKKLLAEFNSRFGTLETLNSSFLAAICGVVIFLHITRLDLVVVESLLDIAFWISLPVLAFAIYGIWTKRS